MAIADLVFWVLAVVSVVSALLVIYNRNIFRSALYLILAFFAVACIYILLSADFLAAVQVLVYIGAIGILIIFAIMLTRELQRANTSGKMLWPGLIGSIVLLALLSFSILGTPWRLAPPAPYAATTEAIGLRLFDPTRGFMLPFEIASILLLVAIIGAIVLVKEK